MQPSSPHDNQQQPMRCRAPHRTEQQVKEISSRSWSSLKFHLANIQNLSPFREHKIACITGQTINQYCPIRTKIWSQYDNQNNFDIEFASDFTHLQTIEPS